MKDSDKEIKTNYKRLKSMVWDYFGVGISFFLIAAVCILLAILDAEGRNHFTLNGWYVLTVVLAGIAVFFLFIWQT